MENFPRLSIIIPSWNQGRFIKRTLLSILNQNYPGNVQVIVSDGGSTDETVNVLKSFGDQIIWWSKKDKGFVDAVMKGAAEATGEILAIQSSDDYYLPGAFRAMAEAFAQNPDAGFVCGAECSIDLSGKIISVSQPVGTITPETILFKTIPPQHASFIRRSLFQKVDGLRAEVDMCADIDLWYRAAHIMPGKYFNKLVAVYQLHPHQRTAVSDKWYPNLVKMVETTQNMNGFAEKFHLDDKTKKDLFSYWEMNWTAKRDFDLGKKIARKKIASVFQQSKRTNRMMAGILFPNGPKQFLKKLKQKVSGDTRLPEKPIDHTIDINWCGKI